VANISRLSPVVDERADLALELARLRGLDFIGAPDRPEIEP